MVLKKEVSIILRNRTIYMEKGERILFARSRKFSEWALAKLLSDAGFRTASFISNNEGTFGLSIASPSRYRSSGR